MRFAESDRTTGALDDTRERIRQIEAKTLFKLKSYRDSKKLEAYIR